jgi:hypothetical protein
MDIHEACGRVAAAVTEASNELGVSSSAAWDLTEAWDALSAWLSHRGFLPNRPASSLVQVVRQALHDEGAPLEAADRLANRITLGMILLEEEQKRLFEQAAMSRQEAIKELALDLGDVLSAAETLATMAQKRGTTRTVVTPLEQAREQVWQAFLAQEAPSGEPEPHGRGPLAVEALRLEAWRRYAVGHPMVSASFGEQNNRWPQCRCSECRRLVWPLLPADLRQALHGELEALEGGQG